MAAEIVKLLKAIGSYSEAEISDAVHTSLNAADKDVFRGYARAINDKLYGAPTVNVAKKEKAKKTIDTEQKFALLISKIRAQLRQYGSTEVRDEWKVEFQINVPLATYSLNNIITHHEQLINSGRAAQKTQLLTFFERGRIYDYLKYQAHNLGNWKILAQNLGICLTTANRYIDFYRLIDAYPRLLVCEICFETIVSSGKRLLQFLQMDTELADQLRLHLRETRIMGRIFAGPGHSRLPADVPQLLTEHSDWLPGWELTDELIHDES